MKTARLLVRVGLALVAAAAIAGATMTFVKAFNPQPDPPGDVYSLIGLLDTQSIELTVSNFSAVSRAYPPGPCDGAFTFYDAAGDMVKTESFHVTEGHSALLSFTPSANTVGSIDQTEGARRTYLRGAVSFRKAGGDQVGRSATDSCVSGLSVVGATGETSLFTNPAVTHGALTVNHNETLVIDTDR